MAEVSSDDLNFEIGDLLSHPISTATCQTRARPFMLTRTIQAHTWIRSLSNAAETWSDSGGIFACPDTDSFSARCINREGHSPLAIYTAEFVHVLVLLAAGFALCYGESINLT